MNLPRVAVVTGGARGIGLDIARRLVADGWNVAILDILPETVAAGAELGDQCLGIVADVSSEGDVARAFARVNTELGPVCALVNNAALTQVHRPWEQVTPDEWDRVLSVNLRSAFLCARAAVPQMREVGSGRIVNISSVTFLAGQRNLIDYVASKGGVVGFTRALAREVGVDSITVNAVSPGSIRTEVDEINFPDQQAILKQQVAVQCIPRRGRPADISNAVSFLVGDNASFITGQQLNVDGGWIMN